MAAYNDKLKRGNSLERKLNCKSLNITAVIPAFTNERFDTADGQIADGDVFTAGSIPASSIVTGISFVVTEAFDDTTPTLEVSVGGTTIATGVVIGAVAVLAPALSAQFASGELDESDIVVTYSGTTVSTVGNVEVIVSYARFGTTNGSF